MINEVMASVLVYQDYVHNCGGLFKALTEHFGIYNVSYCDANDIKAGILSEETKAFFMPGGASRYVADKLNGQGNANIRTYVSNGGSYIGICAGAYYACQRTEWHPETGPVFSVENELAFFPGIAQGPVKTFTRNDLDLSFTVEKVNLKTSNNEKIAALYWGGPVFLPHENSDQYKVLARYADLLEQPAAIVRGIVDKGSYLLISPHLEIDSMQLDLMNFNVADNALRDVHALADNNGLSRDYFSFLLNQFIR